MREKGPTSRSTRTYNSYDIAQGIERERKRHHLSATTMAPPPPRRHPLKSSFSLSLVSSPHLWNSFFYNILHSRHPCILAILRLVWWLRLVQYRMRHSTPRSLSEKKEKKKNGLSFSLSLVFSWHCPLSDSWHSILVAFFLASLLMCARIYIYPLDYYYVLKWIRLLERAKSNVEKRFTKNSQDVDTPTTSTYIFYQPK